MQKKSTPSHPAPVILCKCKTALACTITILEAWYAEPNHSDY